MAYILDSAFLIDLQRKDRKALAIFEELLREGSSFIVPTIVLAEFLAGSSNPDGDVAKILETAVVVQFTVEDAKRAGFLASQMYQTGRFPGWSDVFIAGVAKSRGGLPIITRNDRHFPECSVRTY